MNRSIQRVGFVLMLLLLAAMINLTIIQVWLAPDYRNATGNQRVLLQEYNLQRGPILAGSDPIAKSVETNGNLKYLRVYPNGPLFAPVTGYYSVVYGATGLERTENDILAGTSDMFFIDRLQWLFAGQPPRGGGVTTTINSAAQRAAFKGLGTKRGAVVAIEPSTGKILASVQSPSFDPNILSSHDPEAIRTYYDQLTRDPTMPLLNRPIVSLNPPGSTFKLVVTAAALASGKFTPDSILPGPAEYDLPLSTKTISNWTGRSCGPNDEVTLRDALAMSCNTAFAWLGNQLGANALRDEARAFGFDTGFDIPLRAATSRFPTNPDEPQTAMSAIGQFEVRATALQMAMVGASIGNRGITMTPYLIQDVRKPDLTVLSTTSPKTFGTALSPELAKQLVDMMVNNVEHGTGTNAQIPGVKVGGKTGTAQTGNDAPAVAWFVALAPAENPQVAVAVVVEDAGTTEVSGNQLAAPIAKDVIEAVLGN